MTEREEGRERERASERARFARGKRKETRDRVEQSMPGERGVRAVK